MCFSEHPYTSDSFWSSMLLVEALIVRKITGLVQLRRRPSAVVIVTVCGKHPDFMTSVVIMFIFFPLLDQILVCLRWTGSEEPEK